MWKRRNVMIMSVMIIMCNDIVWNNESDNNNNEKQ